jgi:hypothetical protein
VFEVALAAARTAGLLGRRRVLDSTPLYDAVATMDTVTLIRSAIRGLLGVADPVLAEQLQAVLSSGDKYVTAGKPGRARRRQNRAPAGLVRLNCPGGTFTRERPRAMSRLHEKRWA